MEQDSKLSTVKAQSLGQVTDHLVDALAGDPSTPVRRAAILLDIDQNPGTTQAEILARHGEILGFDKSSLNRDVDWLYDYGCVLRNTKPDNAREIALSTVGYTKRYLGYALDYFHGNHEELIGFMTEFLRIINISRPTLRDMKIMTVIGSNGPVERKKILAELYNGPVSTDNRTINNLIAAGWLEKEDE